MGDKVYSFDIASNAAKQIGPLPYEVDYGISFKNNDTVLILGGSGQGRDLLAFDLATRNYSTVSSNLSFIVKAGAGIQVGSKAFIFDNTESLKNRNAVEFDLKTLEMRKVGPASLPVFRGRPSAVWDGKFGYVTGG